MNKIGEILRSTREKRNLTLTQASDKIKVREEYLEKIENDKILSNDVFTVGYLRLYSKYLRVNIESLIVELKTGVSEIVEDSVEEIMGGSENKHSLIFNKKKVFLIASMSVALVVSIFLLWNKADVKKSELSPKPVVEVLVRSKENIESKSKQVSKSNIIAKISDSEFEVKNINQESNSIRVSAIDSTMVSFFDDNKDMIEEKFVTIGDKISLPSGYQNVYVKSRIPLSIELEDSDSMVPSVS